MLEDTTYGGILAIHSFLNNEKDMKVWEMKFPNLAQLAWHFGRKCGRLDLKERIHFCFSIFSQKNNTKKYNNINKND